MGTIKSLFFLEFVGKTNAEYLFELGARTGSFFAKNTCKWVVISVNSNFNIVIVNQVGNKAGLKVLANFCSQNNFPVNINVAGIFSVVGKQIKFGLKRLLTKN